MFYIDKINGDKVSVKDTQDGISEEMTKDILMKFIEARVTIFGYEESTKEFNSVEYLPLNNIGNYISVETALLSYKYDSKGLKEGDFVVRYMNSLRFRMSAYPVPFHNSRTSNKGTRESTLIKRAMIEVQGKILKSRTFDDLKQLVLKDGVYERGKYCFYGNWSQLEYFLDNPNTIYWRVRMD